jgi:hypothetical protein
MRTALFLVAGFLLLGGSLLLGRLFSANYPAEELPIFLLSFGLPAIVAGILKWKVL